MPLLAASESVEGALSGETGMERDSEELELLECEALDDDGLFFCVEDIVRYVCTGLATGRVFSGFEGTERRFPVL